MKKLDENKSKHSLLTKVTWGFAIFFMVISAFGTLSDQGQIPIFGVNGSMLDYYIMFTGIFLALAIYLTGNDETIHRINNFDIKYSEEIKNLENKLDNIQNYFNDMNNIADKEDIKEIKQILLESKK